MDDLERARCRVLVIDDEPDLRRLVRLTVEPIEGCEVVAEAGDGWEGVKLAALHQPTVVLLDLKMPGMPGLEALGLIRQYCPQATVVVLSALTGPGLSSLALELGAQDYLEKPVVPAVLAAKLRALAGTG